ncbi:LysR family transcriptional regulator [Shimwellia pseudoproteus]|uniref:LysR family transcriptional regulator n=1 Tax=Shimwellia pseudoproteus TaxID=570012 RepID=UPI0018EBDBD3|nr:LysR family transcriptional regulator [Shimwellia pseudoproteus]MBJ3814839.1 LysR family transcriptional regulator [Shimwellia pseudoproteus]
MDSKWLEDFLCLSQYGSFSQAAAARHITQPALSRRIKILETSLGVPLFDRTTTPVTLTHFGQRFEPYARQVLTTLAEARSELGALSPVTDNTLVMVSLHTLSVNVLPDIISYLRQQAQSLSFTVNASVQGVDNHFEALLNRQVDLLVTYDSTDAHPTVEIAGHLQSTVWRYERFIPVISARLYQAAMVDDAPIPWLCYSDYTFVRRIVAPAEARLQKRLYKVFESGLSESIREMVLRHLGLAWLPESTVAEQLASGELVQFCPQDPALTCDIPITIWCNRDGNRPVLRHCWQLLSRD